MKCRTRESDGRAASTAARLAGSKATATASASSTQKRASPSV
jgi:hypothetical protein